MTRWLEDPRVINGYFDIGPIRIPPLPQHLVLTDRADGTLWELTHDKTVASADGFGHISITTFVQGTAFPDYVIFRAYEEPYMRVPLTNQPLPFVAVRLITRGGRLGYEELPFDRATSAENQQRLLSRRGFNRETREIIFPSSGWVSLATPPAMLAWTPDQGLPFAP